LLDAARMRPLNTFAGLALALAAVLTAAQAAPQRVALVIGNGAYRSAPSLPNPPNDASDMAASLSRLGFAVTRLDNAGFDAMRRALLDFGRRARDAEMAVVFFAGHGMELGAENWLIPVDAELRTDADVEQEAIPLKNVIATVDGAARLALVVLDACRNNPFDARMQRAGRARAVARGLARIEPSGNVLVAYAAKDGTTAADGSGRNSPFTAALLNNIETPGLEVNFLFRNVRDEVMAATRREQQPFVYGSLSREAIYLRAPAEGAAAQATVAARNEQQVRTARPRAAGEVCAVLHGATSSENYCASSVLRAQLGNSYGVANLFSNDNAEAWVEGRPGVGIGEWITIEFPELRLVRAVIVRNGYQKSRDIFMKNARVRRLRLLFSGGETEILTLRDSMDLQTVTLASPVRAWWVQVVIDDVYPGARYDDTAITKLFLTSEQAP
jgi:hypothetical protein